MGDVDPSPELPDDSDIARHFGHGGRRGDPFQPQHGGHSPFMHYAVTSEVQVFSMIDDEESESLSILDSPPHDLAVGYRPAIIGDSHATAVGQFTHLRKGLACHALGHRTHRVDPGKTCLPGFFKDVGGH